MTDIAIIGSGIGGVSAALTAAARNKSVLLFGERDMSRKMRRAEKVFNYPGMPEISGDELADALARQIEGMGISLTEDSITAVYDMGGKFALQGKSGGMYEAASLILAMGVVNNASLAGEEENLGMGVSYCATCDAPLFKGKTAAVIAYAPEEEAEARFLSEVVERLFYFPVYKGRENVRFDRENVRVILEAPKEIAPRGKAVITDKGEYACDGVFVLRESVAPKNLIYGLETEGAHVKCDRMCHTSLKGVFACGDITGKPYQFAKAAGEGNVAALEAVAFLDGR